MLASKLALEPFAIADGSTYDETAGLPTEVPAA